MSQAVSGRKSLCDRSAVQDQFACQNRLLNSAHRFCLSPPCTVSHLPPADAHAHATILTWVDAFNRRDLDTLCALYAPGAVLWGTLATELLTAPTALRAYYERALGPVLDTRVELLDTHEQPADGAVALMSGRYRLSFRVCGVPREALARYSFVLVRSAAGWSIRHHHSSLMPEMETSLSLAP